MLGEYSTSRVQRREIASWVFLSHTATVHNIPVAIVHTSHPLLDKKAEDFDYAKYT